MYLVVRISFERSWKGYADRERGRRTTVMCRGGLSLIDDRECILAYQLSRDGELSTIIGSIEIYNVTIFIFI